MSFTVALQARIQQLKKAQADIPNILHDVAKDATMRAVEATADATPPKANTGRGAHIGTNTVTGELKQHWATDSVIEPQQTDNGYQTTLANNVQYASYVNDGHRMDRHFVPGLYINEESGLLEYDPGNRNAGITVGTKTKYVKGEFMVDKGIAAYEKTVLTELDRRIEELFK